MDARDASRAAEKAARDLINTRAALIGELGVAAARHTDTPPASPAPNTTPKRCSTTGLTATGTAPAAQQARG